MLEKNLERFQNTLVAPQWGGFKASFKGTRGGTTEIATRRRGRLSLSILVQGNLFRIDRGYVTCVGCNKKRLRKLITLDYPFWGSAGTITHFVVEILHESEGIGRFAVTGAAIVARQTINVSVQWSSSLRLLCLRSLCFAETLNALSETFRCILPSRLPTVRNSVAFPCYGLFSALCRQTCIFLTVVKRWVCVISLWINCKWKHYRGCFFVILQHSATCFCDLV